MRCLSLNDGEFSAESCRICAALIEAFIVHSTEIQAVFMGVNGGFMWHLCVVENICEVEIFGTFAIEHQDSVCDRTDYQGRNYWGTDCLYSLHIMYKINNTNLGGAPRHKINVMMLIKCLQVGDMFMHDVSKCFDHKYCVISCSIFMQGLLRCMMRQGEFTSAQMHVDGLQMKRLLEVFTSTFLPAGMHGLYAVLQCSLLLTPHNVLHFH